MKTVNTAKAPAAIGPYSQAKIVQNLVFTSGQLGIDPADGSLAGDTVEAQSEQAILNLAAILEAAGSSLGKVVKTTCFLQDIADFAAFNAVYERYFTSKPARSCFAAAALPKGALVEIEAIAELDE